MIDNFKSWLIVAAVSIGGAAVILLSILPTL